MDSRTIALFCHTLLEAGLTAVINSLPLLAAALCGARFLRRRRRAALASALLRLALTLQFVLCLTCLFFRLPQTFDSDRSAVLANRALRTFPETGIYMARPPSPLQSAFPSVNAMSAVKQPSATLPAFVFITLGGVWITGSTLVFLGLAFSAAYLYWLRRNSTVLAPDHIAYQLLDGVSNSAAASQILCTNSQVTVPFAAGWPFARNRIFLPEDFDLPSSPLYPKSIARAVLAHEAAHLQRRDLLWNVLGKILAALLWINPLQWVLQREMEITQELVCDTDAVRQSGEIVSSPEYARCLLTFAAQSRTMSFSLRHNLAAMVAAPTSLIEERVRNIMDSRNHQPAPNTGLNLRIALVSSGVLLAGVCLFASAQIAPAARLPQVAPAPSSQKTPQTIDMKLQVQDEPAMTVLQRVLQGSGLKLDASDNVRKLLQGNVTFSISGQSLENTIAIILRAMDTGSVPISFKIDGSTLSIFVTERDKRGLPVKSVRLDYSRPTEIRTVLDDLFSGTGFRVEFRHNIQSKVRVRMTDVPLGQAFDRIMEQSPDPLNYTLKGNQVIIDLVNPPLPVVTKILPATPVSISSQNADIREILQSLLMQARCDFSISNEVQGKASDSFQNLPLRDALPRILSKSPVPLEYIVSDGVVVIRAPKPN